jgi:dihydrofolate synthase / folylpolyglutamate synthase
VTIAASYKDTVQWLESWYARPHVPAATAGLQRAEFLLKQLGNPQRDFRSVHVAGTAGKGSTTTMIGAILEAAGNRTGYFRSPHLETYRERIAVNDHMIEESAWIRHFNTVAEVSEGMEHGRYPDYQLGRPTLFEVLFAMAALHFQESRVDWVAVETGMGGRLDATNTLQSEVAVVTNVSLEHTKVLGNTVERIAAEKAAIIKRGSAAVTGALDPAALNVITRRAAEQQVGLRCLDRDFFMTARQQDRTGQLISLSDPNGVLDVWLRTAGDFQALNAATAFGAARALQQRDTGLVDRDIVRGLGEARVPGRFEVMSTSPVVLLDGAHNPAAMRELRRALDTVFPSRRIVLLFAAMVDKDVDAMAVEIAPRAEVVVTTRVPETDRAASAEVLATTFVGRAGLVTAVDDTTEGLHVALAATGPDDILVVAGSLYLVGWARTQLVASGAGI